MATTTTACSSLVPGGVPVTVTTPGAVNNQLKFILYYFPGNASMAPHMLLEEVGAAFELRLVDRDRAAQKAPHYLELNPASARTSIVWLET